MMEETKRVLLIAGGGTLGTHTAKELLRRGCRVDVLCPEEKHTQNPSLCYIRNYATQEVLEDLFQKNHYHGIVNFIHYPVAEDYQKVHPFLMQHTDHLIFLSSYRVYADKQHPVTETAPRLHEVYAGVKELMQKDDYGISKCLCEDYLQGACRGQNWTIVRPVISFSHRRFDILLNSGDEVLRHVATHTPMLLPLSAKDKKAGLDWAGNSGKLIANLLFRPQAIGQAFTIYSGHGMTWGEVAEAYHRVCGLEVTWVSDEAYLNSTEEIKAKSAIMWYYDRLFERDIDCSKVLRVTGLGREDFATVEEGIRAELAARLTPDEI